MIAHKNTESDKICYDFFIEGITKGKLHFFNFYLATWLDGISPSTILQLAEQSVLQLIIYNKVVQPKLSWYALLFSKFMIMNIVLIDHETQR